MRLMARSESGRLTSGGSASAARSAAGTTTTVMPRARRVDSVVSMRVCGVFSVVGLAAAGNAGVAEVIAPAAIPVGARVDLGELVGFGLVRAELAAMEQLDLRGVRIEHGELDPAVAAKRGERRIAV